MSIKFRLGDILEELQITKNALAVEAKIRPATVANYVTGEVNRIEIPTLVNMLDALNRFADEKKKGTKYGIDDIMSYEFKATK